MDNQVDPTLQEILAQLHAEMDQNQDDTVDNHVVTVDHQDDTETHDDVMDDVEHAYQNRPSVDDVHVTSKHDVMDMMVMALITILVLVGTVLVLVVPKHYTQNEAIHTHDIPQASTVGGTVVTQQWVGMPLVLETVVGNDAVTSFQLIVNGEHVEDHTAVEITPVNGDDALVNMVMTIPVHADQNNQVRLVLLNGWKPIAVHDMVIPAGNSTLGQALIDSYRSMVQSVHDTAATYQSVHGDIWGEMSMGDYDAWMQADPNDIYTWPDSALMTLHQFQVPEDTYNLDDWFANQEYNENQ